MPVLNRRDQMLARPGRSARNSTESNEGMKEQLWIVDEDFVNPKKEMDFPTPSAKMSSSQKSRTTLRIDTQQDLQDRYLSSEEEPSPSPDDGPHDFDHELEQKPADIFVDDPMDLTMEDFQTGIATAMPILALGRPKLIDITTLAPMHKRKRLVKSPFPHPVPKIDIATRAASAATAVATATASSSNGLDENQSHPTPEPTEPIPAVPNPPRQQLRRKESFPMHAPDSWLPEDVGEEEQRYSPSLHVRTSPPSHRRSRNHHDHHALSIPLDTSLRRSNRSARHFSTRVLDSDFPLRPQTPSSPMPPPSAPLSPSPSAAWKGITRSLSMAKRHSGGTVAGQQGVRRPKMIPRGANEREDTPIIPPFPFEGNLAVAAS